MIARGRRSLLLVATFAIVCAACSTSGRELSEPTMTTLPATAAASCSTVAATAATPEIGINGFALFSPSFVAGGELPADAGADTGNRSPALRSAATPESAAELALVVTDETGAVIYWLVTGIPTTDISVPAGTPPEGGVEQASSAGPAGWNGPTSPPAGTGEVVFAIYALNNPVDPSLCESSHALREHIIADSFATASIRATFTGTGGSLQGG
jgi:phosphatidylethanolamine-binding protein (PEBP) family uncharacterized protein